MILLCCTIQKINYRQYLIYQHKVLLITMLKIKGMMMFKWLEKRKQKRNREIAEAVYKILSASNSWEKFLPPVAIRDCLYMTTENGSVYRMEFDHHSGMELITEIKRGH